MMREKYESLPLATLKELAKTRGLKGISTMKKAEVIELMLKEDENEKKKEKLKFDLILEGLLEYIQFRPFV